MENKKYSLGIDIGTNSVGWCVVDENDKIVKKNGKSLWGVRLFDEATDASDRRSYRSARRRYMRRRKRILLLQQLFDKEISKVDKNFFLKLDESKFTFEDKKEGAKYKYALFNDDNFTDKDYYHRYKTIYHLRNKLISDKEKVDIRLIYLALHHIIKYRGNFLYEGNTFNSQDSCNYIIEGFNFIDDFLRENGENVFGIDESNINKIISLYKEKHGSKEIENGYKELYKDIKKGSFFEKLIILLSKKSVKIKDLFDDEESESKDVLKITEFALDSTQEKLSNYSYDSRYEIINKISQIYNAVSVNLILQGKNNISSYMESLYNKHHDDLVTLKKFIKSIDDEDKKLYKMTFIDECNDKGEKLNNYCAYIGHTKRMNEKNKDFCHCSKEEFNEFLKKNIFIDILNSEKKKEIESFMQDDFLPLLNNKENGIFPYQLNLNELKCIIKNQKQFYPFFNEKDENGITIEDKIISIMKFRIPYFVGPLTSPKAPNIARKYSWAKFRENKKITPWNIEEVIDYDSTAMEFINRMQNHCTYLKNEYCLSKGSIYYSFYTVIDDLNKIYINHSKMPYDIKKDIIDNIYKKNNKVTIKMILDYLKIKYGENTVLTFSDNEDIEEKKYDFVSSLKPYNDFVKIFGSEEYVQTKIKVIEKIIKEITIFEDKTILKRRLKNIYRLNDEQIKKICSLNYRKFSNISSKLLTLKPIDINTGEVKNDSLTLLQVMLKEGVGLNEIINSKENNDYKSAIRYYNGGSRKYDDIVDSDIDEYFDNQYLSPGMKRPLKQAVKIIIELEKILKTKISNFYIETTRTNNAKKGKTDARKKKIELLYKEAIDTSLDINKLKEELNKKSDNELQSKKIFHYFMQCGHDIYSGKPIDLDNLNDYDIDHIIPQAKIKDDSLNNTCLVSKAKNNEKQDSYPIPKLIISDKGREWIEKLKRNKFISNEKYQRLIRKEELSDEEYESFANRQLVYTNQAVKALGDFLRETRNDGNTNVYYVKAENISEIRQKYKIYKSRIANNYHHAHDAYLNAIIGKYFYKYYNYLYVIKHKENVQHGKDTSNFMKLFDERYVYNKDSFYAKKLLGLNDSVYKCILEPMISNIQNRFDILVTDRTYTNNELLHKTTILSHSKASISLKNNDSDLRLSDFNKYGGYSQPAYNYFLIKKDGDNFVYNGVTKFEVNGLEIPILKINTMIKLGKSKAVITGKTNDFYLISKGFELKYNKSEYEIIYKIEKIVNYLDKNKILATIKKGENSDDIMKNKNLELTLDTCSINYKESKLSVGVEELNNFLHILFYDKAKQDIFVLFKALNKVFNDDNYNKILNLNLIKKIIVVYNLVQALSRNNVSVDLTYIGGSKSTGISTFNGKFNNEYIIVFNSITGFYKKEFKVNDFVK